MLDVCSRPVMLRCPPSGQLQAHLRPGAIGLQLFRHTVYNAISTLVIFILPHRAGANEPFTVCLPGRQFLYTRSPLRKVPFLALQYRIRLKPLWETAESTEQTALTSDGN